MNCTPEQARALLHELKAAWNAMPEHTRLDCRYILQGAVKPEKPQCVN